jgi:hypothetical protein
MDRAMARSGAETLIPRTFSSPNRFASAELITMALLEASWVRIEPEA